MKRFQMFTMTTLAILGLSFSAFAGDWRPYSESAFKQAQAEGKTVVLDFHAGWCPTCKKQKPILEGLLKEPEFNTVIGLTVDFDDSSDLKKMLKVQKQSTLVVFKGKSEAGRGMGMTSKEEIKSLIMKGI